jgi:hypothetical protein
MEPVLGIRFYPSSILVEWDDGTPLFIHGTVQKQRSNFDLIFEPLYPLWKDCVLFDHDADLFRIFDPDLTEQQEAHLYNRLDSYVIERYYGRARRLMACAVFGEFGRYVYEFEGTGFCVFEPGTSIEQAVSIDNEIWGQASPQSLPQGVVCLLQNWDGVFWQIFSSSPDYLKVLQAAHGGSQVLSPYWVELAQDFPSPRGSSPEEVGMTPVEPVARSDGGGTSKPPPRG